jgi:hypothetical protein
LSAGLAAGGAAGAAGEVAGTAGVAGDAAGNAVDAAGRTGDSGGVLAVLRCCTALSDGTVGPKNLNGQETQLALWLESESKWRRQADGL